MSPAIFVRYLEKLSKMISLQVSSGGWKGIRLDSYGPVLSHLCFADDMVLFSEASIDQVEVIQDCLTRFCEASGQRVSFSSPKSCSLKILIR